VAAAQSPCRARIPGAFLLCCQRVSSHAQRRKKTFRRWFALGKPGKRRRAMQTKPRQSGRRRTAKGKSLGGAFLACLLRVLFLQAQGGES